MNARQHAALRSRARPRGDRRSGSRRFWSSLEELIDEDGFRAWLAAEFPAAASMFDDPGRRQFLKLMGASLLLAGLAGCSDETRSDQALPYVNQPEDIVPGVPRYYATAVLFEGYAQPVLATTYAGRPTKLDGNPDHPVTRGKSDAFMQSAIFGLYDPERSKVPLRDGAPSTWAAFERALRRSARALARAAGRRPAHSHRRDDLADADPADAAAGAAISRRCAGIASSRSARRGRTRR